MELPEENKRTGLLALAVLGVLLAAVLTVFTVFDGDDGGGDAGKAAPAATADERDGAGAGSGTDSDKPAAGAATPIVELSEVAEVHTVMTKYMAGLSTYDHTSQASAWSAQLLPLTTDDTQMKQLTTLPTGKAWATCRAQKCSSKATAVVERDAVISDDLVRGSGRSISSLVKVTVTREAGGEESSESNQWLVTAKEDGGQWVVSGFDVFGLGDVGASDESGE